MYNQSQQGDEFGRNKSLCNGRIILSNPRLWRSGLVYLPDLSKAVATLADDLWKIFPGCVGIQGGAGFADEACTIALRAQILAREQDG